MHTYILKRPIITERSLALANQQNTYTFEVHATATKNQVKTLIEELFDVTVIRVRTIVSQAKRQNRQETSDQNSWSNQEGLW